MKATTMAADEDKMPASSKRVRPQPLSVDESFVVDDEELERRAEEQRLRLQGDRALQEQARALAEASAELPVVAGEPAPPTETTSGERAEHVVAKPVPRREITLEADRVAVAGGEPELVAGEPARRLPEGRPRDPTMVEGLSHDQQRELQEQLDEGRHVAANLAVRGLAPIARVEDIDRRAEEILHGRGVRGLARAPKAEASAEASERDAAGQTLEIPTRRSPLVWLVPAVALVAAAAWWLWPSDPRGTGEAAEPSSEVPAPRPAAAPDTTTAEPSTSAESSAAPRPEDSGAPSAHAAPSKSAPPPRASAAPAPPPGKASAERTPAPRPKFPDLGGM